MASSALLAFSFPFLVQEASSDASCVISARLVVLLVVELVVHCSSRLVVLVEASSGASSVCFNEELAGTYRLYCFRNRSPVETA